MGVLRFPHSPFSPSLPRFLSLSSFKGSDRRFWCFLFSNCHGRRSYLASSNRSLSYEKHPTEKHTEFTRLGFLCPPLKMIDIKIMMEIGTILCCTNWIISPWLFFFETTTYSYLQVSRAEAADMSAKPQIGVFHMSWHCWWFHQKSGIWLTHHVEGMVPSRELTYPTLGKGKSSSKVIFDGKC